MENKNLTPANWRSNQDFLDLVQEAFFSSQEFDDALEDFVDSNWDGLIDEYGNVESDDE